MVWGQFQQVTPGAAAAARWAGEACNRRCQKRLAGGGSTSSAGGLAGAGCPGPPDSTHPTAGVITSFETTPVGSVIAALPDGQGASWVTAVLTTTPVHLKARCRMANRPIHETRLGKVRAAIWPNKKSRRGSCRTAAALERPRRDSNLRPSVQEFLKPFLCVSDAGENPGFSGVFAFITLRPGVPKAEKTRMSGGISGGTLKAIFTPNNRDTRDADTRRSSAPQPTKKIRRPFPDFLVPRSSLPVPRSSFLVLPRSGRIFQAWLTSILGEGRWRTEISADRQGGLAAFRCRGIPISCDTYQRETGLENSVWPC